ncbi:hypothetical protein SLA2020_184550 [Shorea laevis]
MRGNSHAPRFKNTPCNKEKSYLYKCYLELGMSMKKLMLLLYLLGCSTKWVTQDLWSLPGLDDKNEITSYGFAQNESDLAHGLFKVEGTLVGSSRIQKECSQFNNDRVTLLRVQNNLQKDAVKKGNAAPGQ